jgi:phytoene dehydrogenase-like protein
VAAHYLEGGWYPRGGGHALPRAFLRALKRAGGSIRLRSEVSRILLDGDRAVGVRLADGTEIRAGAVVSNADPAVTFGRLVGREHLPARLARKLDRTRWSLSAMSLFFAAEVDAEALGLDSGNLWYYASPDIDGIYEQAYDPRSLALERLPGFFLTVTTLKDPSKRHGRRHTLEAFSLLTGDAFARWAHTRSGERPPDYEALKQVVGDRMLRSIDEVVPGLASRVVFRAVGTPLSNVHYVAATSGSLYGTEKTRSQVGPFTYRARTPFRGLYLCGASTLSHGVMGAALSGLVAAKAVSHTSVEELLAKGGPPVGTRSAELARRERAAEAVVDVVEPEDLEREAAAPGG